MEQVQFLFNELPYAMAEEIKSLRTNIQFSGAEKKVILMTSSNASEGKSTISLEIARSLTELGKLVLVIAADLRRSEMKKRTATPTADYIGLSHYLSGQVTGKDVVYSTNAPNLYVVFAGPVPPNPSELLANPKMESLLEWARSSFDYIIVDAPPVNMVTDASVIAPLCDGVIYVIKEGEVPRKVVLNGIEQVKRTGCPIMGVVLNQARTNGHGRYYYNNYYKKYYSKYYTYEEDEE